jgi:hypothetical protein
MKIGIVGYNLYNKALVQNLTDSDHHRILLYRERRKTGQLNNPIDDPRIQFTNLQDLVISSDIIFLSPNINPSGIETDYINLEQLFLGIVNHAIAENKFPTVLVTTILPINGFHNHVLKYAGNKLKAVYIPIFKRSLEDTAIFYYGEEDLNFELNSLPVLVQMDLDLLEIYGFIRGTLGKDRLLQLLKMFNNLT